jgi:hypothetical protein
VSGPQQWNEPVTISESGDRVVVETTYDDGTRCQMIFVRDGETWTITICHPGMPAILLPAGHATTLAYGLRQAVRRQGDL